MSLAPYILSKPEICYSSTVQQQFSCQGEKAITCDCGKYAHRVIDQRLLNPKRVTAKAILTFIRRFKMPGLLINNDNVEMWDVGELTLENWKLPPSIEDEEAVSGGKTLDLIAQGEVALYLLIQ